MALTRITTGTISSNAISAEKMQNASIQARHFQSGTITLSLLDANANVAAAETRINANLDIVQDNVATNQTGINTVQSNLVLAEANIVQVQQNVSANVDTVRDNLINYAAYGNTNFDTKANVSATYFLALANDFATYTNINANLDVLQDNITAVHSGGQEFTSNKTFQQNVTIQGNLIVVGSQVDLGVGTATIDDNFIVVSANLTETPSTDSGIIINRGPEGNVFIGDHITEDGIVFALSQSPHDNATIAIQEYLDVHANTFHADSGLNFSRVHFGHADDESTGIIADTTNNHIKFIVSGTEQANINSTGNLFLTTGRIEAGDFTNTLDLDNDELADRQNSVTLRTVQSVGIFLDSNDNEGGNFFNIYDGTDDPNAVTIDDAIFSVRDTGEVFVSDDISVQGNANIILDAVVSNAVIGTRVFEGTVGLQANDSATYFAAYANDFVTYTRLNANVNAVQSNLSTAHTDISSNINSVQDNVTAITGGGTFLAPFTNVNTATGTSNVFFIGKDTAAEANVLLVMLDGVSQPNTEYAVNSANDTVQFNDATIPSGTIVQIFSMT